MRAFKLIGVFAASALASVASAQTTSPTPLNSGEGSEEYRKAYEEAFRASFRTHMIESCVSSAQKEKAAGYDVTPTCACIANTLLRTKTVAELTELSDASKDETKSVLPVAAQCVQSDPPLTSPKS